MITITNSKKEKMSVLPTIEGVVAKLNTLLDNEFFRVAHSDIECGSSSNVHFHNKIVLLLAIFFDSNQPTYDTRTYIGSNSGVQFMYNDSLSNYNEFVERLDKFVSSIDCLDDIQFNIG